MTRILHGTNQWQPEIILRVDVKLGVSWNSMCIYKLRPNAKVLSDT